MAVDAFPVVLSATKEGEARHEGETKAESEAEREGEGDGCEGQSALPAASSLLAPPRTQKSPSRRVKKKASVKKDVNIR